MVIDNEERLTKISDHERLAELVKKISLELGNHLGVVCAYDCLLQWNERKLDKTIIAWERYIRERKEGLPHTDCNRHGALVPSIPL